jgi:hypothetical protein
MRSAEELLALHIALPSFAWALTYPLQNAFYCLCKQSLLRLRFQIHRKQGVPLANNFIIKSTEPIYQPWSILDFGALLISRDAKWKKVHSLFNHYYY